MTPVWGPALGALVCLSACIVEDEDIALEETKEETKKIETPLTCGDPTAYSPFTSTSRTASAETTPWSENFESYRDATTIECSSGKTARQSFDVTAGCLTAAAISTYRCGAVSTTTAGAFRAVALPLAGSDVVKWTDQHQEFRVYIGGTGEGVNPGVKAFVRYRSEDDLYVASWRFDGVVQIQKKQCGQYTTLARVDLPAPTLRAWHRVRFDAVGTTLSLYLDDKLVLTTRDASFSSGTAGIRLDGVTGTYLDDWRVY